jgi:pimeloyl-ACP methyl ester carboxylesterase
MTTSSVRAVVLILIAGMAFVALQAQEQRTMQTNGVLEYEVRGVGEAILLIHGAYIQDALLPLANNAAMNSYRLIRYHRRGYGRSARHQQALSISREAQDALALLQHLGVERANVVGYSSGGVVALELALTAPAMVQSLTLIEPAIDAAVADNPQIPEFLAAALNLYRSGDKAGAVNAFQTAGFGPSWREELPKLVPGALEQIENGTDLFFQSEMHAVLAYRFGADRAARISQPILLMLSSDRAPVAGYVRSFATWLPQTQQYIVLDANHNLPMKQPGQIAERIARFLHDVKLR